MRKGGMNSSFQRIESAGPHLQLTPIIGVVSIDDQIEYFALISSGSGVARPVASVTKV